MQENERRPAAALPPENAYGHTKKLRYILSRIAERACQKEGRLRLLDFGCGNGQFVSRYLISEQVDYVGVDFHPPSLAYARQHFAGPHAIFLEAVPEDRQFDIIVYADVLEHLDAPAEALAAHAQLLSPNGCMIGSVPNGFGPFEIEEWLNRKLHLSEGIAALSIARRRLLGRDVPEIADKPYNHESGHVVFFTRSRLNTDLSQAGLRITDFRQGAFVGASISGSILKRSTTLTDWNVRLADHLPAWAVSTWYFTMVRDSRVSGQA